MLLLAGALLLPAGVAAGPVAPYRVLLGNDVTNILTTPSPFRPDHAPFQEEQLRRSVDEAAGKGAEVLLLQPGLGWVPLWQSRTLPMADHLSWQRSYSGREPDELEAYVAAGGDVVRVMVDECRRKGLVPFVSLRLNDVHNLFRPPAPGVDPEKARASGRFYAEHPEFRLGPQAGGDAAVQYMLDWTHPEVRAYKLALIRELAEYDVEGVELDFMRHPVFFDQTKTTARQRRKIMRDFIGAVRRELDRKVPSGRRRWLAVRVPGYPATYGRLGVDLRDFVRAGVDMVTLSGFYFTDFQIETRKARRQLPAATALYQEVQFASAIHNGRSAGGGEDKLLLRTTPRQLCTAAHLAYARGANGISVFNFHYYRGTYNAADVPGRSEEPPWDVLAHLGDRAWLGRQPQSYILGTQWNEPDKPGRPFQEAIQPGSHQDLDLDTAPPSGGWKADGILRLQAATPLHPADWQVTLNGKVLNRTAPAGAAVPAETAGWVVPVSSLRDGTNRISLRLLRGDAVQVIALTLDIG